MSKNTIFYTQTTKATVPASSALTGTYETIGTVMVGDGTLFTTEIMIGDWIYSPTKSQVQVVENITSDTSLTLREEFVTDVAAGEVLAIVKQIDLPVAIKIENTAAGTAVVDTVTLPVSKSVEWTKSHREQHRKVDCLNPVVLDATGTSCLITILKY